MASTPTIQPSSCSYYYTSATLAWTVNGGDTNASYVEVYQNGVLVWSSGSWMNTGSTGVTYYAYPTGLIPHTPYTWKVWAAYDTTGAQESPSASASFTTTDDPPSSVSSSTTSSSSGRVTFTANSYASATRAELYYANGGYIGSLGYVSSPFDVTGLNPSTSYKVGLWSENSGGNTSSEIYTTFTTQAALTPAPAPTGASVYWSGDTIYATANSNSSIGVLSYEKRISNAGTGYDTGWGGDSYWGAGNANHHLCTTSTLNGGDKVEFRVRYNPCYSPYTVSSNYATCGSYTRPTRPPDFAWTYAKTSGQTVNVYATEWNSFTSRISDFISYLMLTSKTFTYVYSGTTISALIFNEARNAVSYANGTSVPAVNSGDTEYASYFNQLVTDLNSIT